MRAQLIRRGRSRAFVVLAAAGIASLAPIARATPPSSGEPPIVGAGVEADYLRSMHRIVHFKWTTKFVEWVASTRPPTDPINDPNLEAEVLFIVRWDGSVAQVSLAESSGVAEFDAAALAAVSGERPYPVPPVAVYSDDGVVHVRWVFRRDGRACSGGEIRRLEAPLREALPRLLAQGRTKEALLRAARDDRAGNALAMPELARAYLARPFADPMVDARAAAALARAGDPRAVDRLRRALNRPDTMPIAAPALAAAHVDLCPIVRPALEGTVPDATLFATLTLRAAAIELAPTSPCVQVMAATIEAGLAPAAVRADMLDTLTALSPNGVRRFAVDALGDRDPKLRAAGARALARPKGGRPTLYRLQPLIGDPSVEVRAAVAAGLVRACGDLANDFLQPLLKGRDLEPLLAMADELGRASSPGSAELLAKLQKRPEPELRLPLLAALAMRNDPAGRALYQPLADGVKKDPYAPAEARRIVYARANPDELARVAKDPVLGPYAFRGWLRAGRRSEALDWLVTSYDRLSPEALADALGAWLANATGRISDN